MLATNVGRDDADAIDNDLVTTADAQLDFSLNTVQEYSLWNGGLLTSANPTEEIYRHSQRLVY